jgi:hypothetical protein
MQARRAALFVMFFEDRVTAALAGAAAMPY